MCGPASLLASIRTQLYWKQCSKRDHLLCDAIGLSLLFFLQELRWGAKRQTISVLHMMTYPCCSIWYRRPQCLQQWWPLNGTIAIAERSPTVHHLSWPMTTRGSICISWSHPMLLLPWTRIGTLAHAPGLISRESVKNLQLWIWTWFLGKVSGWWSVFEEKQLCYETSGTCML